MEIKRVVDRADKAFNSTERKNAEHIWKELTEFLLNNQHGLFLGEATSNTAVDNSVNLARGAAKTRNVYSSVPLQAVQDLAAAFQGTVTNPATIWSGFRFQDDALNDDPEATVWLEACNKILHNHINESNFNTEIAKGYQSLVALANMPIFLEEKDTNKDGTFGGFRFTALHLAQVSWSEDKEGQVDTVYRKFQYTAKQAFERWGNGVHDDIKKALEKAPETEFSFLHCIKERDAKDVKLNELGLAPGDKRPVASLYIDASHHVLVEESGYYEFPVFVPRWSLMPQELYGRGPGHIALPDTKTLNKLSHLGLQALSLQVRPPLFVNQRDILGTFDLNPGGVSVVEDINGIREHVSQARTDIFQFTAEELKNSIRSTFFLDKLLLPPRTETGEMSAYETNQRVEQMHRVLGPTLSRLNNELLQPCVIRMFKMLLRANKLPEQPDVLKELGINVEVVFENQLARAQKAQDISSTQQWLQVVAGVAQLAPEVVDTIDADGIAKISGKTLGVPEGTIRSPEEVAQIREQRAQQAQQAQAMEAAVNAADINSKMGGNENGGG